MAIDLNTGAKAAFKGFRTQTLYILDRILNSNSQDVFYPEGAEDLLIKSQSGEITEVIQIKNYSSNLALSNLEPEKEDSFFRRSLNDYYNQGIHPKIILVSFGILGQELESLMTEKESPSISKKLVSKKYNYSEQEVNWLFKHLSISTEDEANLTTLVTRHLSNAITGFSSAIAFDLLMYWLYLISEKKEYVNRAKLIDKLQSIGLFFSRRKSFLSEFGTTILPFEISSKKRRELLANEFYQGVSTRYEHIVEGFDAIRDKKITEIQRLFRQSNVVLIQGASGQGKSTLAYRYLHSYIPENHSFRIQQNFSLSQISKIQAALKILVKEYDLPIIILIDVVPNDFEKWTQLVKSLIEVDNLKLLVTIRAEDYNRSENIGEFTKVGDLLLDFSKPEAQDIYESISKIKPDFKFTSFEEAWINFGEAGSLLEFVYLITQGESLEIRLRNQIKKIEKRYTSDEIYVLKVIAIAHGYECEINISSIKFISTTSSLKTFIEELENEYFLRTSSDNKLLLGLHPIRSQIISNLLIDASFDDVEQIACDGLKIILEKDISKLLLNFFYENNNPAKFLKELNSYKPINWEAAGNILRALFWLGIKEFSIFNKDLIIEFQKEYHSIIFLLIDDMGMGFDLSSLKKINEERIGKMEGLINQLSNKEIVYSYGKNWLSALSTPSILDMEDKNWDGMAYVLYWVSRLGVEKEIDFSFIRSHDQLNTLSTNTYANVLLAFYSFNEESKKNYDKCLPSFILRIRKEYKLVILNIENEVVETDFIYDLESEEDGNQISVHQITKNIIDLLRKALPDKETYSTQGYGHKISLIPYPYDDSTKNISKRYLPISWRTEINGIFHQYVDYQNRPVTWKDYTETVIGVRKKSLELLTMLSNLLEQYFKKKNFTLLEPFFTNYKSKWYNDELSKPNHLPKVALDKWGYAKERGKKNTENSQDAPMKIISQSKAQFLLGFGEYLEATRGFFTSLSNFYNQIDRVYMYNLFTHNKTGNELERTKLTLQKNGYNPEMLRLSIINLFKAFQELPKFQMQFDKHFSKFYSSGVSEALNEEETTCYLRVSLAWKQFAEVSNQSNKLKKKSQKVSMPSASIIRDEIENKLDNNLISLCNSKKIESYDIVRFEDNGVEKTAILFDVNTPIDIYLSFQHVLKGIRKSFAPASYNSIKRLIIDQYFSPIIIVPLVYNRVVLPLYYQVPSFKFLDSDGELTFDSVGIYSKKVSNEMLSKLNISLWETEIPNLKNAQNLLGNNINILLYLNHLVQIEGIIEKLDDDDEQGIELIMEHNKPMLIAIANLLMQSYSECNLISSDISLTSDAMIGDIDRQDFSEIYTGFVQNLLDFGKLFNLHELEEKENFTVTATITTEDIAKWNTIFQDKMQGPAMSIYLYWASELIKNELD